MVPSDGIFSVHQFVFVFWQGHPKLSTSVAQMNDTPLIVDILCFEQATEK